MAYHQQTDFRLSPNHENNRRWKLKQLLKPLEAATGSRMLSLLVPPSLSISHVIELLDKEYASASKIDSDHHQLQAIISAQQKLKQRRKIPANGLVMYIGTVIEVDFEPFKPVEVYLCVFDNKFHPKDLSELLEPHDKHGFIVLQKSGALLGILGSYTYEVLEQFTYGLPTDYLCSADCRFMEALKKRREEDEASTPHVLCNADCRNKMSALASYLCKASRLARKYYINHSTNVPSVVGVILFGEEDLTKALRKSPCFIPDLKKMKKNVVEGTYGGEEGFNEAIDRSKHVLPRMRMLRERRAIRTFFGLLQNQSEKCVYGVDATLKVLWKHGAVTTLLILEDLKLEVRVIRNKVTGIALIKQLKEGVEDNTEGEWNVEKERIHLVEWLATEYSRYSFILEIVSSKTKEGYQFSKAGFEGIAGTLMEPKEKNTDDSDDGETTDEDGEGDFYDDF